MNNGNILKLSKVQLELCQITFDYLLENGHWPKSRKLHVDFREKGDLWDVANGIDWKILITGDKHQADSITKLKVEGISSCKGTDETLGLFIRILRLFVDSYINAPEAPKVTFDEIKELLDCEENICIIACIIISGESGLFSGYSILPDGKITDFKLNPDILRFEKVNTIDDYLNMIRNDRIPANELDASLQNILSSYSSTQTEVISQDLLSIIPEIIKDGNLCEIVLQDVREIQCALENRLWKSVSLLCGSACEGILLSVLRENEAKSNNNKTQSINNASLSKLIQQAIKQGILKNRDAKLAEYIRDSRNVIHPNKALKNGTIDKSNAIASHTLLGIVCDSIKNHIK